MVPLVLTGEYIQAVDATDRKLRAPAMVRISVNGTAALDLPTEYQTRRGWPGFEEDAIIEAVTDLLTKIAVKVIE